MPIFCPPCPHPSGSSRVARASSVKITFENSVFRFSFAYLLYFSVWQFFRGHFGYFFRTLFMAFKTKASRSFGGCSYPSSFNDLFAALVRTFIYFPFNFLNFTSTDSFKAPFGALFRLSIPKFTYLTKICGVPGMEFSKLTKCPIPGPREP